MIEEYPILGLRSLNFSHAEHAALLSRFDEEEHDRTNSRPRAMNSSSHEVRNFAVKI